MRLTLATTLVGLLAGFLAAAIWSGVLPLYPARADVEYRMAVGVDIPGNDIQRFELSTPDPALCRQACDQNSQCQAWTFVRPGAQAANAMCWLKNHAAPSHQDPRTISGVRGMEGGPNVGGARIGGDMMMGVNYAGNDIASLTLPSGNPALCQQACNARGDCRAWVFVKERVHGPNATCWLKGNVPAASYHDAVVSGVRTGGGAEPPPPPQPDASVDVSGAWVSSYNNYTYIIEQNGNQFGWYQPLMTQTAKGTLSGNTFTLSYEGGGAIGTVKGVVKTDANGRANRIEYDNGVVFSR